ESVLSAHPDASIFVGIGSGSCIGANEALIQTFGKGRIPQDVGVITTDITVQQLNSLKSDDEAVRAIIGFEGSNEDTAEAVMEMFRRIYSGEFNESNKNVVRPTMEINKDNVDQILAGM
ncbi:MAG: sugar ABC transporter substrate-binding protein, partial [Clostridia bacterium]|nr:sugar ABC transporter substrate-binding protein [Clostridia bacterium]